MNSQLQRYIVLGLLLIFLQIPLLHNWVFYDVGFPFFYVGFLLFLPQNVGRGWLMVIGFFIGLTMDVFSNTPGMHAFATVFVCFVRERWFSIVLESTDRDAELTVTSLGWPKFITAFLPLVLFHHLALFVLENEGFEGLGHLTAKTFWSTLVSFFILTLIAFATAPKKKR
jgi:rod shape-determining protein MreD